MFDAEIRTSSLDPKSKAQGIQPGFHQWCVSTEVIHAQDAHGNAFTPCYTKQGFLGVPMTVDPCRVDRKMMKDDEGMGR